MHIAKLVPIKVVSAKCVQSSNYKLGKLESFASNLNGVPIFTSCLICQQQHTALTSLVLLLSSFLHFCRLLHKDL